MTIPWTEMHCGELSYRVLSDVLGIEVRRHDLWIDTEGPGLDRRVEEYLASQADRWERVGRGAEAATTVGDVIWSLGPDEFGRTHLSVVVTESPVLMAISTTKEKGPHLCRPSQIRAVKGVYRFAG